MKKKVKKTVAKRRTTKRPPGTKSPDEEVEDGEFPFMIMPDGNRCTLRPPAGGEFTINFGGFLVVSTDSGCALVLTSPLRQELLLAMVDMKGEKKDRLICLWPDKHVVDDKAKNEILYEKITKSSLEWMPKDRVP